MKTVTTQSTSKKIKAFSAISKLALVGSLCLTCFSEGGWRAVGLFGMLLSIFGIVFARWAKWWQHE